MRPHYEVFRFGLIRGPRPERRAVTLELPDPAPPFVSSLLNGGSRSDVRLQVGRFLANEFDPGLGSLTIAQRPILPLRNGIRQLGLITRNEVDSLADQTLALCSRDVASHGDFFDVRRRLATGIIALKFGAERYPGLLRQFAELYNMLDLFRDARDFDVAGLEGLSGSAALSRPVALPAALFPHLPRPGTEVLRDSALDAPSGEPTSTTRRRVTIGTTTLLRAAAGTPAIPAGPAGGAGDEGPPSTVGVYRPALLPLFVTRQQIKRYEGGEIAHVENVLQSEHKQRDTRRLRRSEESFRTEEEFRSQEERDQQSTLQLDLQQEIENSVAESVSRQFGVSVSAGYGPYFTVSANYGQNSQTDFSRAQRFANEYSRTVIEKAAFTVSHKVKETQTTKLIEEFEEKNTHGFDNAGGQGNIRGVYQWIDKIYENQIFSYGLRFIFVLHIPEPATFLMRTIEQVLGDEALAEPEPFTLSPWDITSQNYRQFVDRYGATDFDEPPAPEQIIPFTRVEPAGAAPSADASGGGEEGEDAGGSGAQKIETYFTATETIPIPPGYRVDKVRIATAFKGLTTQFREDPDEQFGPNPLSEWAAFGGLIWSGVRVTIGNGTHAHIARDREDDPETEDENESFKLLGGPQLSWKVSEFPFVPEEGEPVPKPAFGDQIGRTENEFSQTLFAEDFDRGIERLPIMIKADFVDVYAVRCEIRVVPDAAAWNAWRIGIHKSITEAYRARLTEYRERLAELRASAGISISGRNPLANRQIERDELKRHSIRAITGQSFSQTGVEIFDQINGNFPQTEAMLKGRYADFFETAIDWRNMTFELHPYYWARRQTWVDRLLLSDTDPDHARFLKSGSATVRVPVNPEFEHEILHFIETGQIWAGGDEAPVTSEQNVALLEELLEYRALHGTEEVAEGDKFSVRLPTTLVGLRPDDALPTWEWDEAAGEWVASDDIA